MMKIMGVRLVAKISYLGDRLAGRAGRDDRPTAPDGDPVAHCRPASRTPLWVLPGAKPYTGAEGALRANVRYFPAGFCFCSGFGG